MKPIRMAVIGVGHLGRIHARLVDGLEGLQLAAVVDPVAENRQQVAQQHQTPAFEHHRELAGKIDAAVLAVPTCYHHQIARELIAQGVHLLVEKPLAANALQAAELVEAAQRQRVVLQVGHVERFNPAWASVLPHVRQPKYIEAVRRGGFTFRSTDIGVVLDLMIHDLDLVLSLVSAPVERVDAMGISIFGQHEDVANARLVFADGCVATLSASRASHTAARTMHLWTPRCFASVDFATRDCTLVRPSQCVLQRQLDLDALTPEARNHLKEHLLKEHLPLTELSAEPINAIGEELQEFAQCIRTGRQPRVSGQQGHRAVAVAEQILDSIQHHAWNGTADGPVGPLAKPAVQIIPAPHWDLTTAAQTPSHRRAG